MMLLCLDGRCEVCGGFERVCGMVLTIAMTNDAFMSLPSAEPSKSSHLTTWSCRLPLTCTPTTMAKANKCTAPMLPPTAKEQPKFETYKQAWSLSEQHLLERLLSEIPNGKNNWYEMTVCSWLPCMRLLNIVHLL